MITNNEMDEFSRDYSSPKMTKFLGLLPILAVNLISYGRASDRCLPLHPLNSRNGKVRSIIGALNLRLYIIGIPCIAYLQKTLINASYELFSMRCALQHILAVHDWHSFFEFSLIDYRHACDNYEILIKSLCYIGFTEWAPRLSST